MRSFSTFRPRISIQKNRAEGEADGGRVGPLDRSKRRAHWTRYSISRSARPRAVMAGLVRATQSWWQAKGRREMSGTAVQ
jgi:hypothetical protein